MKTAIRSAVGSAGVRYARPQTMPGPRRSPPRRPRARVPRRRRSPELARQEILDAAERVFLEAQPDQVGLKQVAREAGVSHALITHYFGTYAGLIETVLERRIRVIREGTLTRLREAGVLARPNELLSILFRSLEDPIHLRLLRWLLASERPAAAHAFALRNHGLQLIAQQMAAALSPQPTRELIAKLELALVTAVSAAYGYAMGKHAFVGALGRELSSELDADVQRTLGEMLLAHLRTELGAPPASPAPPSPPTSTD